VLRSFNEAGAQTVLITDDLLAPAAGLATHVLACAPAAPGEFDTAAPGIVLVEALAAAIAARVRGRSDQRRDLAERLGKQFGTY
jgi:DNA-binding MurR/RpiR family transcriptional regulator